MSVYRPKGTVFFWYDFWYAGRRYRENARTTRREEARFREMEAKLRVRHEIGGLPLSPAAVPPRRKGALAPQHMYFIRRGDAIKIGVTRNVKHRVKGLQVSHPDPITLIGSVQIPTSRYEGAVHRAFHDLHLSGEWFAVDDRLIEFIDYVLAHPQVFMELGAELTRFGDPVGDQNLSLLKNA